MDTSTKRVGLVEYLIEAWGLGTFMVSACLFDVVLEHPHSPVRMMVAGAYERRAIMGGVMGITAILILCSRWGKRSGAHINPAVTLSFYRLGRIHAVDALFYVVAQSIGSILGVCLSYAIVGSALAHSSTRFVVTIPSEQHGVVGAFVAEVIISAIMMTTVLVVSGTKKHAHLTPYVAGLLVMLFITFEAPFSGMSINPARTLGSAVVARTFDAFWIYVLAPIVGMVGSSEIWRHFQGRSLGQESL